MTVDRLIEKMVGIRKGEIIKAKITEYKYVGYGLCWVRVSISKLEKLPRPRE